MVIVRTALALRKTNSLSKRLGVGMASAGNETIRIEIVEKTLVRLLSAGQVCAGIFAAWIVNPNFFTGGFSVKPVRLK
jgi:hypothetical protein